MNKIIDLYKKYKEIINYLIIGVLTTLISLISYFLLTISLFDPNKAFELSIANILSWIISVTFAYFTNRIFVFESKDKKIVKESVKFYFSRVGTLLIELLIMFVFVNLLEFNDKIIKIIAQVTIIILNYIFSKLFVFTKKRK